jgi:hypothetical protein
MAATSITLRGIPEDVYKIIIKEQGRIKHERAIGMFGIEQTIYSIVREWKRCREEKPVKP